MNHEYCKRINFYRHVLQIPQFTTKKEYKGREKYQEFEKKSKRNKIVKEFPNFPKLFDVELKSEKLNILTIVDCIILNKEKGEAYPLQVKYSYKPNKLYRSQKLQLALESILIEDQLHLKVPFGFIKFLKSNDIVKIPISDKLRNEFWKSLNEIEEIIRTERFPEPTTYRRRCIDCCYRMKCWGEHVSPY